MSHSDSEVSEHSEENYEAKGRRAQGTTVPMPQKGTKTLPFTSTEDQTEVSLACDHCGLAQKSVEANAFCPFCKRYMCVDCQHDHSTAAATSAHIMLIGKEMPKTRVGQSPRKDVDRCGKHAFRMAEFFCPKHDDVFCIDCKEGKHIRCPNVTLVRKLAKGVKTSKEFASSLENFRKMVIQFERLKTIKIAQQERLEGQLSDSLKAVNAFRSELNELLDKMQKNIIKTIEKKFGKELSDIKDHRTSCEAKVSILQEEIANLELVKSADETRCFVALLKAKQRYTGCESVLNNLTKHKREMKYEFEPNQRLLYSMKELDTLGNIKTTFTRPRSASRPCTPGHNASQDVSMSNASTMKKGSDFALCGEHNIESPEDSKRACSVTGSVFLPDGRLLLCDSRNNSVKLFDQILQLKSTMKMPATPYDVTGLKSREIVVAVPEKKELHFAIMDPDLRTNRVAKTEIGCHGIRYHRDGLLTTCYSHGIFGIVLLLDMDGTVLQRFERDSEGNAIFQGPYYIAVNPVGERFYVTDKAANTVLGMTMGGKVLFRYRSKELEAPGSITVDKNGALYICGRDSKNIHVIKPDGRRIMVFQSEDGLEASSICYRPADGLFVVATNNSNTIRSYKLM